ncbi:MAG: hypothetical protein ACLUOI_06210 [Eisenbergiella sp.]
MKRKAIALIMAAAMIFTGCEAVKRNNNTRKPHQHRKTDGAASAAAQKRQGADPYGKYENLLHLPSPCR